MTNTHKRILLTGGGSGGHIFPLVAVTQKIKEISPDKNLQVFFVGADSPGIQAIRKEGIQMKTIFAGKIRRSASPIDVIKNILDFAKVFIGFIQSFWYVWRIMPDVIFSKGGFGSFTTVCVGWIYRIPIVVHDSDAVPGLVNRITGKLANSVALSFKRSLDYFNKEKSALTGTPIRKTLLEGNKETAMEIFKLHEMRPVLFVFGGSQGSQPINKFILRILPRLLENFEVIHQCGRKQYDAVKVESGKILTEQNKQYYHLYPFLRQELKHAYAVCDLIISRAGSQIHEIAAIGKASILIPLPNAGGDHQRFNAFDYARSGAAMVLKQENLTPSIMLQKVKYLITNNELRQEMESQAKNFARLDAADKIAEKILELAH